MADELDRAEQSNHSTVAAAHYELAFRYSLLAFEQPEVSSVVPFVSKTRTSRSLRRLGWALGNPRRRSSLSAEVAGKVEMNQ